MSAFERALDELGSAIVRGELAAGHATTVEELERRTGCSRGVVRETTRVLVSLGMLSARRRVGLRVLPDTDWDVLDPHVIRWRLAADPTRVRRELADLRGAIEPLAARLAATERTEAQAGALQAAAEALAGAGGDAARFLDADRDFHDVLLIASGNPFSVRLGAVVHAALRERAEHERAGLAPDAEDVALHTRVAEAVRDRDAGAAESAMRALVMRTHPEHPSE
ncbi:DNA-binding FadR family transcriptional regulator [Diaminobutyricimonas aerilata]|uniref:DNA-binding FadR family transcriptional regulator n=1 Tax=Diaminobutyricimonas aerilata TaxID=1162967 RepID=A0A2M9CMK5_9MICO|nr:FCD domain-containing protein [Diaminobutyricimonas aerilata]PJJ73136.1 DNA-binding FadR family transcriptional regulator [Diaminobutyricimonas aerilata]